MIALSFRNALNSITWFNIATIFIQFTIIVMCLTVMREIIQRPQFRKNIIIVTTIKSLDTIGDLLLQGYPRRRKWKWR